MTEFVVFPFIGNMENMRQFYAIKRTVNLPIKKSYENAVAFLPLHKKYDNYLPENLQISNIFTIFAFAFGNAVASDCAWRNKGDACLRSPHCTMFVGTPK